MHRGTILRLIARPETAGDVAGIFVNNTLLADKKRSDYERQIHGGLTVMALSVLRVQGRSSSEYGAIESRVRHLFGARFFSRSLQYVLTLTELFWREYALPPDADEDASVDPLIINIYFIMRVVQNWCHDCVTSMDITDENVDYWLEQLEFQIHLYYRTIVSEAQQRMSSARYMATRFAELVDGMRSHELTPDDLAILDCAPPPPQATLPPPSNPDGEETSHD